jgi:hypothetical protein
VTIARSATFLTFSLYAAFSPLLSVAAPKALASKAPAPSSAGLTFRVTARVGATGQFAGPQQTVQARVLLLGPAARVETETGGTPSVVLFNPPYVYRLLPKSKAGVRWKLDTTHPSNFNDFDPQSLLRDPSRIKVALTRGGAKKLGNSVLTGVPVEIYEARDFGRKGQKAKVWLRRSDSLPVRLEASGGQMQVVASWRDYARPQNLSAALFTAPKGYRVRQVTGRPPFSAL